MVPVGVATAVVVAFAFADVAAVAAVAVLALLLLEEGRFVRIEYDSKNSSRRIMMSNESENE